MRYRKNLHWIILTALLMGLFIAPHQVSGAGEAGAVIVVSNIADEITKGDGCSLREAILSANFNGDASYAAGIADCTPGGVGVDTVIIPANAQPYRITLGSSIGVDEALYGDFDIYGATIIQGYGPKSTIVDAQGSGSRVFHIHTQGNRSAPQFEVTIQNMAINHGSASGFGIEQNGGGILNLGQNVHIYNVSFGSNLATDSGGAINNTMGSRMDVRYSMFASNVAQSGGGGAIANQGELSVYSALFSLNNAPSGGAVHLSSTGVTNLTNVTISENNANQTGAIYSDGTLHLAFSTITLNKVPGLYLSKAAKGDMVSTIISVQGGSQGYSPNCAYQDPANPPAEFFSAGYNLEGVASGKTATCTFFKGQDQSLPQADLKLDTVLSDEPRISFSPKFYKILDGSPAIDASPCSNVARTDQRTGLRPAGIACDIGAYEFGATLQQVFLPSISR